MTSFKVHEIDAVHERNLVELLQSMGLLEHLENGKISCRFCGRKITMKNLGCIFPSGNEIVFCCDDMKCFEQVLNESKGEK
jgi:hypothetical protein